MDNTYFSSLCKKRTNFLFFLFLSLSLSAQLPSGFVDVKVQSGYTSPTSLFFSKNGQKMFVSEKSGKVWTSTWNGTTYIKQATPALDLSQEVGNWRDFGLMSVALDPNFDTNGLIYLFYQVDRHHLLNFGTPQYNATTDEYFKPTISRLTRYKLTTTNGVLTADNASRKILLGETKTTGVPTTYESHAGGKIVFGTDGTLIVSTGDNASFVSSDMGSASETYWEQAVAEGMLRATENVGAFRAQLINSFCGKLLRLDPNTGDAIPSNPYYDAANPRSAKSRVWALGFRNPFRITHKTGTGSTNPADGNPGTIIVGDVQNGTWEEVHIVEKGGVNCGWPLYEGIEPQYQFYLSTMVNQEEAGSPTFASLCVRGGRANINNPVPSQRRFSHAAPALDWGHRASNARYVDYTKGNTEAAITVGTAGALVSGAPFLGNCVTGGDIYKGTTFPTLYQNAYFFADYSNNWIKAVSLHDNEQPQIHEVIDFAPDGYCKGIVDLVYCARDQSMFYININTGDIQRISFGANINRPPVAVIGSDKTSGVSPLAINFNSTGSNDPDGNPITYAWDFGDGTSSTAANPSHTFTSTGSRGFTVKLTVKDNQGLTDTKTLAVSTNNTPPSVKITNPVNNSKYSLAEETPVTLNSTVTDNDATGLQYAWQVTLRHNTHEHRDPVSNLKNPTVQVAPVGCDGETYYFLIELKVTDNGGLTAMDSVKIYPDCNSQSLSISNLKATAQNAAVAVSWTNPAVAYDEIMVVAKANSGFLSNPSGTNYTANVSFTGGGSAFEGGKVVYRGTGTNTTVTSLTNNTRYYFRVFARKGSNWTGGLETSAVPVGTTTTPQLGCLKASYFNNQTLSGSPVGIRAESNINNEWVYGGPTGVGVGVDNFSVRWEGTVIPPTTGAYIFSFKADDGVRLWVNNVLIINKWFDQSATSYSATVNLTQGQNVPIKVEYYEGDGRAAAKLSWTIPNQTSKIIEFNACPLTPSPFSATKCYRLMGRSSLKAVEVPNNSTTNGTQLQQNIYNATKNQVWRIKDLNDGSYRIVNGNSGKSIDLKGLQTIDGAPINQYDWNGGNNQRWILNKNTEGYYEIKSKHSGKDMTVQNASVNAGAPMWQLTASNLSSQQFKIDEVGCPSGTAAMESVNILSALGYRNGKKAVITWVSNANANSDYFVVQKLNTFELFFEKLETVNTQQGTGGTQQSYTVTDNSPTYGENYYRVALYRSGEPLPQYSEIILLDFSYLHDYMLFPNPSSDYVDVDLEADRYRAVDIKIMDAMGKIVKQQKIESAPIVPVRINTADMEIGQYFIRIEAEGKREVVKKLMIMR